MRFPLFVCILCLCLWGVAALPSEIVPRQDSNSLSASPTPTISDPPTELRLRGTNSPKASKSPKPKPSGLTKAAKIGIGVGVPLGVLAIAGSIAAYIIGKRKGRKRRVDDPTAGAGKKIQDPSPELNIPPPTPLPPPVAELPTVQSNDWSGAPKSGSPGWSWKSPFSRSSSTKKAYYQAPQSPQEMPA